MYIVNTKKPLKMSYLKWVFLEKNQGGVTIDYLRPTAGQNSAILLINFRG